ncbi:DUF647-domain-containing protein [Tricholoma matsutake]|nr:DUF647-domain-containing protein [Tricholoma matsutake 945]
MASQHTILERDESGRTRANSSFWTGIRLESLDSSFRRRTQLGPSKVFLPSGYPQSVSPGAHSYPLYQILNALQAFCNSLAGLLSSRAILEGFGVGDPSATATHALLLTVLQDVFSPIYGAYAFGSSLVPEAKTYRLLADSLNDAAVILDTLSPLLSSHTIPSLRVGALCLSASFRALCGIAAGGSKAAITLHFATPIDGTGDVGDLNAKDSSKETVLALLGMLLGSIVVPHLVTPWPTYTALFLLVAFHLGINYLGVRGLVLRTLNRQRVSIAWTSYRLSNNTTVPNPKDVSQAEHILSHPAVFRDPLHRITGTCTIGLSFFDAFEGHFPFNLFEHFEEERYLLWYDAKCLRPARDGAGHAVHGPVYLHIILKDGYTINDQLKAWIHAAELCSMVGRKDTRNTNDVDAIREDKEALALMRSSYTRIIQDFPDFIAQMRAAGWNTVDGALMPGSPKGVLMGVKGGIVANGEDRVEERKER